MFKTKILRNIILCLLIVFATSGVSLICFNSIYHFHNINNINPKAYDSNDIMSLTSWDFDGNHEVKKNSDFDSFSSYVISDHNGLQTFSQLVNWGTEEFSGKSVYLTNDIDCGGNNVNIGWWYQGGVFGIGAENRYFKGNLFDGQNYTISNFVVPGTFYKESTDQNSFDYGLFSCIESNTTIQNLRLKDNSFPIDPDAISAYTWHTAGGMVGYLNGGTIKNCIVENLNVTVDSTVGLCLGGIFGVGYGTISNCLVKKVTIPNAESTVGIGPAEAPYWISTNAGGTNLQVRQFYSTSGTTISNCVVQNVQKSTTFANFIYMDRCDTLGGNYITGSRDHTITTCINQSNNLTGFLDWSSTGGTSGNTWYYVSDYNSGYPYLRQFIKDWKTVNFRVGSGNGTVSMSSIVVPSAVTAIKNGSFITVGQTISATPSTGYFFESWEGENDGTLFIANFTTTPYTLTFKNAETWQKETNISPSETTFNVDHNTSISVSHRTGEGPLKLIYSFVDLSGKNCSVVYDIPEGYNLRNPGNVTNITSNRNITPNLELGNFTVTFKYSAGCCIKTGQFGGDKYFKDLVYTIRGGSSIEFDAINLEFEFDNLSWGSNRLYYIKSSGVRYDGLKIKMGGKEVDISALDYITGDVEIMPIFVGNVTVTFGSVDGTSIILSGSQSRTISVELNSVIEANLSPDRKILTYTKNNEELITYVVTNSFGSDYDVLFAQSVTVVNDMTITPQIKNVIYKVTFAKEDSLNIATMSERKINYSPPGSVGLFPIFQPYTYEVKYGTTILFEYTNVNGILTYVYTLKNGDTIIAEITYNLRNNLYSMQLGYNEDGKVILKNGMDGQNVNGYEYVLTKDEGVETISPTFGYKQYGGEFGGE